VEDLLEDVFLSPPPLICSHLAIVPTFARLCQIAPRKENSYNIKFIAANGKINILFQHPLDPRHRHKMLLGYQMGVSLKL
jgi:hypothetical protein